MRGRQRGCTAAVSEPGPSGIRLKRAYAAPAPEDGVRILVDRLWPRGLRKTDAAIDRWVKDIAPSTELRRWFAHDPARWEEFRCRYRAELAAKIALLDELQALMHAGPLTLVYAAADSRYNHAAALREVLVHR
jgi:uncharacterized protein YeaO (DUF488 family)